MIPSSKKLLLIVVLVFGATLLALLVLGNAVVAEQKTFKTPPTKIARSPAAQGEAHTPQDAAEHEGSSSTGAMQAVTAPPPVVLTEAKPSTSAQGSYTGTKKSFIPSREAVFNFEPQHEYSRNIWTALEKARLATDYTTVVPMVITPMFHDGDVLPNMLKSVNVPVRHFYFVWNSNDEDIKKMVEEFKRFPYGVSVAHNPSNFGFSASINHGLRLGLEQTSEECPWFWVINCDVTFPADTMPEMTKRVYASDLNKVGMMYGPGIDHYAFVVSRRAVEVAGLMDENFYPAYFEDVDWRWRINLAEFEEIVFHLPVNHIRSHNLKKGADPQFMAMHSRHGNGWPYGAMKWGEIRQHLIHERYPPSGWKNPFGIDMPINMWVIDPERMECIKTGRGTYHPRTGNCWYNGYKVLAPVLKNGTWFPECMKNPYPDAFQPR